LDGCLRSLFCVSILRSLGRVDPSHYRVSRLFVYFFDEPTSPDFAAKYARARDLQADAHADEITALSDEEPPQVVAEGGAARVDAGWVTWQKNRIDARKWVASKLKPKKYGDAATLELTGGNGGPVEVSVVQRRIVDPSGDAK